MNEKASKDSTLSGEATEKGQTIILSVVKPGCLYIDVMIGGKTSKCLIDTGSSVKIVSKSLYERVWTNSQTKQRDHKMYYTQSLLINIGSQKHVFIPYDVL